MKKLIVSGIAIACIVFMYYFPHAMLNPGALVEGHQKLNEKCLACHNPFQGILNDKCITCHKLSDIGKDSLLLNGTRTPNDKILFHHQLTHQKCTSCHSDHKGIKPAFPISRFSHDILTESQRSKCNSCHVQPADNLHRKLSAECNSCHITNGWKSSVTFNHDMIQGIDKNDCVSCHQKPDDEFHQQVKENCDKCHGTGKWKPSTFDHSNYFQLDGDHNVKCKTCHTNNNFSAFTCYGCHEHSEGKIREEHHEHGIYNFTSCASCHRSGNEHDIRTNANSGQELDTNEFNKVKKYIKSEEKDNTKEHKEKKEHDND